jgi:hypothetical protein
MKWGNNAGLLHTVTGFKSGFRGCVQGILNSLKKVAKDSFFNSKISFGSHLPR